LAIKRARGQGRARQPARSPERLNKNEQTSKEKYASVKRKMRIHQKKNAPASKQK